MGYTVWIEFEHYAAPGRTDNDDGHCIVEVIYDDGRTLGFNVWTVDLFKDKIQQIVTETEEEGFYDLPDLLVTRLERQHIESVLKQVLPREPE